MRIHYFDTRDGVPVRGRVGVTFANDVDAIKHSEIMASRICAENPSGNVDREVVVIDESGREIHRQAIYLA